MVEIRKSGNHMRKVIIAVFWCLGPAIAFAQPTGLQALTDLWSLPEVEDGAATFGESSHDRTGLNNDGFTGFWSRLYIDKRLHVLYDAQGPGCLNRMWFTLLTPNSRLMIFVDNNEEPVVNQPIEDFFFDVVPPFLQPLVWDDEASSGGFVSYVPICYQDRLIVAATRWTFFYNFTAQSYWSATEVESFTGTENYSAARAMYDPTETGNDPKDTSLVDYLETDVALNPGATGILWEATGAGQVASLKLTPDVIDESLLNQVRLTAYFDDDQEPAVNVPLGMFFGATAPGFDVSALLFGIKGDTLYCFFPMPYFKSVSLALANDSGRTVLVDAEIGVADGTPDDHAGIFTTAYNISDPPRFSHDHPFAEVTGQGKITGVIQFSGGYSGQRYLEGDERFYPDGSRTPTIQGTGTEDYYNGGWYFNKGLFSLPTHGHPQRLIDGNFDSTGMYRLHIADALNFHNGAAFSIEHDAGDFYPDEVIRSCTFLYRIAEPGLILEDELDVGDSADEAHFAYQGTADEPTGNNMFFYEGDKDLRPILDTGYRSKGAAAFTVRVNPFNDGIRLVRRVDQLIGRELVRVFVDDQDAGLWGAPERNFFKRWRDTSFDIPPSFTKGKHELRITLQNAQNDFSFTQYYYWIYSWKKPVLSRLAALNLTAPASEMRVGEKLQLAVDGVYLTGNHTEVTGWVDYEISDPLRAQIVYGEITALAPGEITVTALTNNLLSNIVAINILPADADDDAADDDAADDAGDDDQTPDDDAGDDAGDNDVNPPSADDDNNDGGCGC